MDICNDSWNACLLFRNKQLTKQLKNYNRLSGLVDSSSLMLTVGQLLRLHQKPFYGIIKDESEWHNIFVVIDLFYGGCLSDKFVSCQLSTQELKLCYLVRARLSNKAVSILFNITPRSVLKAKQRIKNKLNLSAADSLDTYIQQC